MKTWFLIPKACPFKVMQALVSILTEINTSDIEPEPLLPSMSCFFVSILFYLMAQKNPFYLSHSHFLPEVTLLGCFMVNFSAVRL